MEQLFLLLNTNPTISTSKEIVEGVLQVMRAHEATLAIIHAEGAAYVSRVIIAGQTLLDWIAKADAEQADVVGAQAASTEQVKEGVSYGRFFGDQVRSIAPSLAEAEGKALRAAYAVTSYRLSVERVSDLLRILEKLKVAHSKHGATLLAWGLEQADLDRCDTLITSIQASRESEIVERNEAESAVIYRDEAEAAFYELANGLLRRVLAMQSRYPDMARAFASVLNKHRAALATPSAAD